MSGYSNLRDDGGQQSLTFYCGDLPADDAIRSADHEPNGYFWEGLLQYVAPHLAAQVELDSEGGMFAAYGARETLEKVQAAIEPYVNDGERCTSAIREAEGSGFEFDD